MPPIAPRSLLRKEWRMDRSGNAIPIRRESFPLQNRQCRPKVDYRDSARRLSPPTSFGGKSLWLSDAPSAPTGPRQRHPAAGGQGPPPSAFSSHAPPMRKRREHQHLDSPLFYQLGFTSSEPTNTYPISIEKEGRQYLPPIAKNLPGV